MHVRATNSIHVFMHERPRNRNIYIITITITITLTITIILMMIIIIIMITTFIIIIKQVLGRAAGNPRMAHHVRTVPRSRGCGAPTSGHRHLCKWDDVYYTVLYYTVLYYTILYDGMRRRQRRGARPRAAGAVEQR